MGKTLFITAVVGLALLSDSILPPLLGLWAVPALPAVLVFFLLQYGVGDRVVMGGALLAFLVELMRGITVGSLIFSFLGTALLLVLAGRFVHVTPLAAPGRTSGLQRTGVAVGAGMLLASFWLFFSLFETIVSGGAGVSWWQTIALAFQWRLLVPSLALTLVLLALARAFEET